MSIRRYNISFLLLCVIALLTMFSVSLINPLLSIFAKEIGATGVWIGYSVAGYWVSRVLLEIPSGFISSRYGYYKPMAVGLALTLAGNALNALVINPVQLLLVRVLMGIGAPLFFAVSMTLILNLFGAERRGGAMGLFQGIEFMGTILGSTFSGTIITRLGFRGGFLLSAALVAVALALLVAPPFIRSDSSAQPATFSISFVSVKRVFLNKNLLIVSSATFAEFIMSTGIIYTIYPIYANEGLGFSLSSIGYIMGARSVGFVVSLLVMGRISDRVGRRPVLICGLASTAIFIYILSMVESFAGIIVVILLIGVITGAIWIVSPVLAAESVEPVHRGAAIGTYRTFFDLGSILGPIIMTYVTTLFDINMAFYIASALLILNLAPSYLIEEDR